MEKRSYPAVPLVPCPSTSTGRVAEVVNTQKVINLVITISETGDSFIPHFSKGGRGTFPQKQAKYFLQKTLPALNSKMMVVINDS